MAGETKPAPLLKQTKKKDCFNRREASVIDAYFIRTFYPIPSIFRVKRWQHSYSSPFWPPPIFFYYTQNTRAYQPTHPPFPVCENSTWGGLSILWACQSSSRHKYHHSLWYCNRTSHQASMTGQNLCKPPSSTTTLVADGWPHFTQEAIEGMRQQ